MTSVVKKSIESSQAALTKMHTKHETMCQAIFTSAVAANRVIELKQSHFSLGSVIIGRDFYLWAVNGTTTKVNGDTSNMVFKLSENIVFDPNPPSSDSAEAVWAAGDPLQAQFANYSPTAFGIGFFSALVVHAKDVVIDLNGYSISQGDNHILLQRFYSNIELASLPFLPTQGPHTFGSHIESATNVCIINGSLGKASHHGIHGNNTQDIMIKNVNFSLYEVASIHLNGATSTTIENVSIDTSNDKIPTLGTFSSARFIRPYVDVCVTQNQTLDVGGVQKTASSIRTALRDAMYNVWQDVVSKKSVTGGWIQKAGHPTEWSLFSNPQGVVDGNPYGIAIGGRGVAVNGFPMDRSSVSSMVYMKNVSVKNHIGAINEIPALIQAADKLGTAQIDPIGSVFQTQNVDADGKKLTINDDGTYKSNVVADAQALVASAILAGVNFGHLATHRNSISQNTLDWIAGTKQLTTDIGGGVALGTYSLNGDSMFHVNKGVIGYKLDAVEGLYAENCRIYALENKGKMGFTQATLPYPVATGFDSKPYQNRKAKSNKHASYTGYSGADTRGWSLASSKNVWLRDCVVKGCIAQWGAAYGVDLHWSTTNVALENLQIDGMDAASTRNLDLWNNNPTSDPNSIGIRVASSVSKVDIIGADLEIGKAAKDATKLTVMSDTVQIL